MPNPNLPTALPEVIAMVVGALSPMLIQLVVKKVTNEMARFWIALVLSALVGVAAVLLSGTPLKNSPEFLAILFTFSSIAFKTFWKPMVFNKVESLSAQPSKY